MNFACLEMYDHEEENAQFILLTAITFSFRDLIMPFHNQFK